MNPSTPQSISGQPIILAFENVSHVLMLGDTIAPPTARGISLSYAQRIQIDTRLRMAMQQNVPLVIVLWPSPPKTLVGLEPDRAIKESKS